MRSLSLATYLLLCILLGGSVQGVWTNLALQLLGIALMAFVATAAIDGDLESPRTAVIYALISCALLVVLLQLIPLPADMWTRLPGRSALAEGYTAIGYPTPALPISETPYVSVTTLFAAIPALATFSVTGKLRVAPRAIALAIVLGMVLGIVVGALQVAGGPNSWAYFYRITNRGGAVGFFANANHMATLLLVGIPMAAALVASSKADQRSVPARYAIGGALFLMILVGIALNGSLASFVLVFPVLLASASIVPTGRKWHRLALPVSIVAIIAGVGLLTTNPIPTSAIEAGASTSVTSRAEIWATTTKAVAATFPIGTGLGSFAQVYRQFENPADITKEYVNHAHNDYLEIVLELGAAGALLGIVFLLWWGIVAVRIWRSPLSTPFARAATIATAAILAHSVVDFPLRTAAISTIFAALIALMTQHLRSARVAKDGELHTTRHIMLG